MSGTPAPKVRDAVGDALSHLVSLQQPSGAWRGDYSGPVFLIPLHVGVRRLVGAPYDPVTASQIVAYLRSVQNADGGFGLGESNPSTVFSSVLVYVALRILGVPAHDHDVQRARRWFLPRGGGLATASWGRFFLCLMGLQPWEAVRPIPPELWLLPKALPFHPSRFWCHSRMVYLPMAWLYGRRFQPEADALTRALREEIHPEPYHSIRWSEHVDRVASEDAYTQRSTLWTASQRALGVAEALMPSWVRRRALAAVREAVRFEDEATSFLDIGPVSKVYNLAVAYADDPTGPDVARHLARLDAYLWVDDRGARIVGYNSAELWDTGFALLAMRATGRPEAHGAAGSALDFVDRQQLRQDPAGALAHDRHPATGGWPFSTAEHGWPITDCTALALEGLLAWEGPRGRRVGHARLRSAVDRLLDWQNPDGSWASYERTRAPAWVEALNPSDVFADILVDRGHVECSSAAMQGLAAWRRAVPSDRPELVEAALRRGADFVRALQRPDGSWEGGWAACFTYGTWFGVWGLLAAGADVADPAIRRAVDFLVAHQHTDGSWGEHVGSCAARRWVDDPAGTPTQTAWALLTLHRAGAAHTPAAQAGAAWLRATQQPTGGWAQEPILGVFNRTCSIRYDTYRHVFPLWALAVLERHPGPRS